MAIILPANTLSAGGYTVANSCRFNDGDSSYLSQSTSSSTGKIFTLSFWMKKSTDGSNNGIFVMSSDSLSHNYIDITTKSTNGLDVQLKNGSGGTYLRRKLTRVFRDFSAWMHVCIRFDSTNGTADDRLRIYVNGTQETAIDVDSTPAVPEDYVTDFNNSSTINIARNINGSHYYDGYLAEMVLVDGSSLAPTSFGEFDEDSPTIWKPIDVSGLTFGTNGFYLDFEDSANLGNDANGGTDLTEVNLAATDQATDTPTNNFATMNPLCNNNASLVFTNGNLEVTNSTGWLGSTSTLAVSQGKWYWEVKYISGNFGFGIGKIGTSATATINLSSANNGYVGKYPDGYEYFKNWSNSQKINNNSATSYGTVASVNDVFMVAFDADIGAIWVGRNGTWYASATQAEIEAGTTTNAMYSGITINDFFTPTGSFEGALQYNFGNAPYTISSGNADGNSIGNFEYSVPSGYFALCTSNLATEG